MKYLSRSLMESIEFNEGNILACERSFEKRRKGEDFSKVFLEDSFRKRRRKGGSNFCHEKALQHVRRVNMSEDDGTRRTKWFSQFLRIQKQMRTKGRVRPSQTAKSKTTNFRFAARKLHIF